MTAWDTLIARAEAAMSRRAFTEAQRHAEALLEVPLPRGIRGRALLVAADAAYATRAYSAAARHYGVFVAGEKTAPEAARAAMALGWARLRSGDRDGARAAWTGLADTRPTDAQTPMALGLAAELAGQAADTAAAERLLDRLIAQYPTSVPAGPGLDQPAQFCCCGDSRKPRHCAISRTSSARTVSRPSTNAAR